MTFETQGLINSVGRHTSMGESGGHFESGRWVKVTPEEPSPEEPTPSEPQDDIEARIKSAAGHIGRGIDELIAAGSDLIGTPEGRLHLGKKLDTITGDLHQVCDDLIRDGMEYINQARDRIMK